MGMVLWPQLRGAPLRHALENAGGDPKAFLLDVAVLDGLTSDTFCLVLGTPCWLALSRLWRLGCAGHSPPM